MVQKRKRSGRSIVQLVAVGAATLVGGAIAIPQLATTKNASTTETVSLESDLRPEPLAAEEGGGGFASNQSGSINQAFERANGVASAPPPPPASLPQTLEEAAVSKPTVPSKKATPSKALPFRIDEDLVTSVQVYYATDRSLIKASDSHLWMQAVTPSILCVLITGVLTAGCIASKRKWIWGSCTVFGVALTVLLGWQSIVRTQQLYRLAQADSVWFSTGRFESGDRYPLHLGTSTISLPPRHREGELERPSIFKFEFKESAKKHVMVQKIEPLEVEAYFDDLKETIGQSPSKSAMVFIHGYNVQFDDALMRMAQLALDMKYDGAPILYSWPSRGKLAMYTRDEASVAWTVTHLEQFLMDVRTKTGVDNLHIVAHSMGNRALVGALERLALRFPKEQPMLGQVILAAPDLDAGEFQSRYASPVQMCARRATVYSSSTDRALLASMTLHGAQRMGLTSTPQPTIAGIDVVDVTPVDTSLLGHSYYGSHPLMIRELKALIESGFSPKERNWLTTLSDTRVPPLYRFRPELAAASDLIIR